MLLCWRHDVNFSCLNNNQTLINAHVAPQPSQHIEHSSSCVRTVRWLCKSRWAESSPAQNELLELYRICIIYNSLLLVLRYFCNIFATQYNGGKCYLIMEAIKNSMEMCFPETKPWLLSRQSTDLPAQWSLEQFLFLKFFQTKEILYIFRVSGTGKIAFQFILNTLRGTIKYLWIVVVA